MNKIINIPKTNINYRRNEHRIGQKIGYKRPTVRGYGQCGICIEGSNHPEGERQGKQRLYGTCVCDMHYATPNYRMITKTTAINKYNVTGQWIENMNKQGYLDIYRLPNPHNPGVAPPMKLIREYQIWSLITNMNEKLNLQD